MKKLNELIDTDIDVEINGIKINSKNVNPGDLFICTDMGTLDRHEFIDDAIERGAAAIIVKKDVGEKSIPIIKVENPNDYLPIACSNFYDNPENKMKIIGVTGTDGKTTIATMVQTLLGNKDCGYIGTNGYTCSKFEKDTDNTTPDSDKLYGIFDEFVKADCKYVSMEVCSEALMRGRVKNLKFDVSIISNITSEHLNIHGTLENYIESKNKLFSQTKQEGYCILNKDDAHFEESMKCCNGKILTYGKDEDNDLYFKDLKMIPGMNFFTACYKGEEYKVKCDMAGLFNVYNLCAAMLAMFALGYKYEEFSDRIETIKVPGRLEMINLGQDFYAMVDYAHTPNGINNILKYVRSLDVNKIITVSGQAGERDASKRKYVGEALAKGSDYIVLTMEDPRSEDPKVIADMMMELVKDTYHSYEFIADRGKAIQRAIDMANPKDIVLVLGKGNENYEKMNGWVMNFNDIKETKKAIENRLKVEIK